VLVLWRRLLLSLLRPPAALGDFVALLGVLGTAGFVWGGATRKFGKSGLHHHADLKGDPRQRRHGLDPRAVSEAAQRVRAEGKTPRALYVVPDFSNPSGDCLDMATREGLLAVAEAEDLLILEDDPYGLFGLDDRARPRLTKSC